VASAAMNPAATRSESAAPAEPMAIRSATGTQKRRASSAAAPNLIHA